MDTKINSTTLGVTTTVQEMKTYDYAFLLNQRDQLMASLAEVTSLISRANALGIGPSIKGGVDNILK